METKSQIHPDDLLVGIGKSIMGKALVYSILAHLILTGATSIPLFKDWTVYGVKSPSAINAIRTEENRQKEEAERRRKAAEKAEAEAKAKAAEEAKKNPKPAAAQTSQTSQTSSTVTPPEVQPLPPKKEFQYGDDLSLD